LKKYLKSFYFFELIQTNISLHHVKQYFLANYLTIFYIIMQTGKVKFFNESKGFGFIVADGSGEEIFVHVTGLNGVTLRENDSVQFEVTEGKRGLNAINVKKI
jgi:cold shock protein